MKSLGKEVKKDMKGSICYRKDGRYMWRYKTLKPVYGHSQKECIEKAKMALAQLDFTGGKPTIDKTMILNTWFEYWLDNYQKPKLRESTFLARKQQYLSMVYDGLGKKNINKIGVDDLREFLESLPHNTTQRDIHRILKDMYDLLFKSGYISKNFMDLVVIKFAPFPQKEKKTLSHEDERILFGEVLPNTQFYGIAKMMLLQALRIGEALALCWEDIDFQNNTISVSRSYSSISKKVTETKTVGSKAIIPLFKETKEMLLERGWHSSGLIFTEVKHPSRFSVEFTRLCKTAGINISPHTFRHTFASRAFEKGINPKTIQGILRHKSYETTINAYTHVSESMKQDAVDEINSMQAKDFIL